MMDDVKKYFKGGITFFVVAVSMVIIWPNFVCAKTIYRDFQPTINLFFQSVYKDVLKSKSKYPELADFKNRNLFVIDKNAKKIAYRYGSLEFDPNEHVYEFALAVIPIQAKSPYVLKKDEFSYEFPLIDKKIVGYQVKNLRRLEFDIEEVVKKFGYILYEAQFFDMPFEFEVVPTKNMFLTNEDISFDVIVKNNTNKTMRLRALDESTLTFIDGTYPWGTFDFDDEESTGGKRIVLKPYEKIKEKFSTMGSEAPGVINMTVTYMMTHQGINPSRVVSFKVVR